MIEFHFSEPHFGSCKIPVFSVRYLRRIIFRMKTMINFSTSSDDVNRYKSADDLRSFYRQFGCAGLELMYMEADTKHLLKPDMIVGLHLCCAGNWMELEPSGQEALLTRYRSELDYAQKMQAEYVVFHITQVTDEESLTYHFRHSDAEVIEAACAFINRLLEGKDYSFHFLMENLWWPGLTFLDPSLTNRLLEGVRYEKKGFMLDTGHFMHTNLRLRTQDEAIDYLNHMLDAHEALLPMIKGIHLHQSLTGAYVEDYRRHPARPETDPAKLFCQTYEHIFRIDKHLPFTAPGVRALAERISPLYLTYEYISSSREEHARYLAEGSRIFHDVSDVK